MQGETRDKKNASEEVKVVWGEFVRTFESLERSHHDFQNAIQELSSSLHLSVTLQDLWDSIEMVSTILQHNAANLFPDLLKTTRLPHLQGRLDDNALHAPTLYGAEYSVPLHVELVTLAEDITELRKALMSFPDFLKLVDPYWPLAHVEEDLRYWSSCLSQYTSEYTLRGTRIYVLDLSKGIGDHFTDMTRVLEAFTFRVPAAITSQNRMLSNLQNQSTMATFFSGVTATMLQYSLAAQGGNRLSAAANGFWFASLVLSVASALVGFSAYMWRRAMYSSPRTSLPRWLWGWLRNSPGVFLILSVVSFLCGLSCFCLASQSNGTKSIVFICEAACLLSLAPLFYWALTDKYRQVPRTRVRSANVPSIVEPSSGNKEKIVETEVNQPADIKEDREVMDVRQLLPLPVSTPRASTEKKRSNPPSSLPDHITDKPLAGDQEHPSPPVSVSKIPLGQRRVRRIVMMLIIRKRMAKMTEQKRRTSILEKRLSHISEICPKLRFDEDLTYGYPMFNPSGSTLALATVIRCATYGIDESGSEKPLLMNSCLNFTGAGVRELAWSSCGVFLLTWTVGLHYLHVWSMHGERTFRRPGRVTHVQGLPQRTPVLSVPLIEEPSGKVSSEAPLAEKFVFVENYSILGIIDTDEKEHLRHPFSDMRIEHLDLLGDDLVVMVVTVLRGSQKSRSFHALLMRKLIVFNLDKREIVCEVPLWREAQYVSTLDDPEEKLIAVSYQDEPPQIWSIQKGPNGTSYLSLQRQLQPRISTTNFRGRAQWLNNSHFLVCLTSDGDAIFWQREREEPIHVLSITDEDKDKAIKIACRPKGDDFMFVTKSEHGSIRFWSIANAPLDIDVSGGHNGGITEFSPVDPNGSAMDSLVSFGSLGAMSDTVLQ